jgi:hypothetical protein
MILLVSPLKGFEIHPKGSDPLLGSDRYKPGIFAKNLQNDEGRVKNYPYFAQISDFSFIPNMSLACVPGPCGPKKAKLGRNLLLCHIPAFSSLSPQLSLRSNPSFLQGHWRQRVKRSYPPILHARLIFETREKSKSGQNIPPYNMSSGARTG